MNPNSPSLLTIFLVFLRLGCTSFGGPVAHLGYFNEELVKQRRWLDHAAYANLVSLCHFIPGPSSSQVGLGIGYSLAGWRGAIAAWLGFTLPSAVLMTLLAIGVLTDEKLFNNDTIHYLKVVALAVVAQAIWQMSRTLLKGVLSWVLCVVVAVVVVWLSSVWMQLLVLLAMALVGLLLFKPEDISLNVDGVNPSGARHWRSPLILGMFIFFGIFLFFALAGWFFPSDILALSESVYRSGALVFGGGHVVLPVLQQEVIANSAIDTDAFLAGYGLVQAVPGPLFTFAAYIGALWVDSSPLLGALVGIVAIFLPSFILVPSVLPVWQRLQYNRSARGALAGLNIGVIGLLVAIFANPLLTTTVLSVQDAILALIAFAVIFYAKLPVWVLVLGVLILGWI